MENLKVLRLVFRQPAAHYRVGFTQQHLHRTLPLPPPSTLIGFIHNMMGCQKGETIKGFDIAVCGGYESVFYQYQLFRNIGKSYTGAYKESHPGSPMPNQVQLLYNVYMRIYITFDSFDRDAPGFMEKFANPDMPFIIGRREDLAVIENKEIVPVSLVKDEFPQGLEFDYWVSKKSVEEYGVHGPVYLLGTYYKLQTSKKKGGIRDFERRRFYYIEPQPLNPVKREKKYTDPVGWIDEDEIEGKKMRIPVFFLGINRPEQAQ